jgi:2-dehydro-3-deoxyphosphogluconate aldolase / (4S)-4-hydroxy-2-oxoglutarate aldolase
MAASTLVEFRTKTQNLTAAHLTRQEVRETLAEIGVIPSLRPHSIDDALFAAEALGDAGLAVVEINVTSAESLNAISHITEKLPNVMVGATGLLDAETAFQALDLGAKFLSTSASVPEITALSAQRDVALLCGAFTATEIVAAWKDGADFVKVFPCDAAGGHTYIRSLHSALPDVRLIASGGVNQLTALSYIESGASAIGVGKELVPRDAVRYRQGQQIRELARRFLSFVRKGRS